jgi:hypothetical protein
MRQPMTRVCAFENSVGSPWPIDCPVKRTATVARVTHVDDGLERLRHREEQLAPALGVFIGFSTTDPRPQK